MAHYIDADKLIHDLEERIYAYSEGYADGDNCRKDAIETLLKDVKYQCSLQQEQPEVDLEKELAEWMRYGPHTNYPWCTIQDAIKITAEHFYELGLNARKEDK